MLIVLLLSITADNETVAVELEGSPVRLTYQPKGVTYAVNLGGPVYESTDNIVFDDQQSLFTFDKEEEGMLPQSSAANINVFGWYFVSY